MKAKNVLIGLVVATGLIISSCEKEKISPNNQIPEENQGVNSESMTVLGDQLENPYSVSNMKKAYSNLKSSSSETPDVNIETTHYYIRFLPKSEEEFDLLKEDTSLILYDIPLDFEIEVQGVYYHDPKLPDTAITWQYCAVTVEKKLPDVYYEKLADLYIPPTDEADEGNLKSTDAETVFYETLEDEALRITGNIDESVLKSTNSIQRKKKWRPAGRIRVWDDVTSSHVPVQGVEVRARRWFTTHKGTTNSQGNFSCDGRFRRDANYSLKWETYHFSIRSGTVGQAKLDGPKKRGDWNKDITGGKSEFYGTIFRAARHYYYGSIQNLRRPPKNSFWKPQMKVAAMYKTNDDANARHAAWARVLGVLNWIKIWNPSNDCDDIYATTIHELAHASHWNMGHSDFNNTDLIVKESWARGVQRQLTRMVYSSYSPTYSRLDYTGIVQDMIDGNKTTRSYYHSKFDTYSYKTYADQVSGYSIKQIEDALKGQKNWNGWRNNIKNKYSNGTENNLDAAFTYWNSK